MLQKVLQGLFLLVFTGILSIGSLLSAAAFIWLQELPDLSKLDALEFTATSQIFARNGELIGEILPVAGGGNDATTNRIPVSLNEVSPAALAAIVASEDDQFFRHFGFDVPAILKATYLLITGEGGRGGSTITTQVVKNTLLSDIATEQSVERKAKEVMLAVELERRLTKPEILQRYINVAYWGGNLYGIRAASKAYFDKDPIELSLIEGLYLARLIPLPSANYNDFVGTREAMKIVLKNMVEQGVISQQTADSAWLTPLEPKGWKVAYNEQGEIIGDPVRTGETLELATTVSSNLAPHITWAVRNELGERFGNERLFGKGGLRVYTTINPQMQRAANEASRNALVPEEAQVAIVGLDPTTGEILAIVGERLQNGKPIEEFNRALDAERQPGSSFKPIIYATAIEQGGYTQSDVIADEATVFRSGTQDWRPANHDNTFVGLRSLRGHLDISRNIPVAKLVEALTPEVVTERAHELGYVNVQPYLSLSLGAFEVTLLQHASGMGAFANGGVHVEPHLITRVEDSEGNILFEANPQKKQVWSPQTAYIILDMLHGNVEDPGAFSRRAMTGLEGRYVAGKTGTTNDERDIWFVGMTPGIVAAIWIGYDDNRSIPKRMTNPTGEVERVTSSRQPIYIWREFVAGALRGALTKEDYAAPEGIEFYNIDLVSGRRSSSGVKAAFVSGTTPGNSLAAPRNISIMIPINTQTNKRADINTPPQHVEWRHVSPENLRQYYIQ